MRIRFKNPLYDYVFESTFQFAHKIYKVRKEKKNTKNEPKQQRKNNNFIFKR